MRALPHPASLPTPRQVDEAGCVLECATPLLLRQRPSNLVLVGDHRQLQAFSHLMDPPRHHCRCGMVVGLEGSGHHLTAGCCLLPPH